LTLWERTITSTNQKVSPHVPLVKTMERWGPLLTMLMGVAMGGGGLKAMLAIGSTMIMSVAMGGALKATFTAGSQ